MSEPIKLTYAEVVEKAKEAYLAGRLSAQGPRPECSYRDETGRPCIVGAALTDDEAEGLTGSIDCLHADWIVRVDNVGRVATLQRAHDEWASYRLAGDIRNSARLERKVRRLLGLEASQ